MATSIVVADAQATPVNHTFVPIGLDQNDTYWWSDQSASNALGYWRIGVSLRRPQDSVKQGTTASNRNYVAKIQIVEPVLANVTNSTVTGVQPAPTLAYVPRSYHEFILPEWSAVLDRQNLSKMSPLILQNAQIKAVLENLAFPGA